VCEGSTIGRLLPVIGRSLALFRVRPLDGLNGDWARGSVMAASDFTVREIAKVLREHVDEETLEKIVNELFEIRGDKSFRETIEKLAHALKATL
jgi:hypothetical protein